MHISCSHGWMVFSVPLSALKVGAFQPHGAGRTSLMLTIGKETPRICCTTQLARYEDCLLGKLDTKKYVPANDKEFCSLTLCRDPKIFWQITVNPVKVGKLNVGSYEAVSTEVRCHDGSLDLTKF